MAVSYTHLDVYKRQLSFGGSLIGVSNNRSFESIELFFGVSALILDASLDVLVVGIVSGVITTLAIVAVSYTHLDVYKRQDFTHTHTHCNRTC